MSIIKSGTTSTTAFAIEGNTNGDLIFQTGAVPTTALSISASQVVTFPGTSSLDFTGALKLSGGTANGVLYLNGSKDVTSGNGLSYNGSALAIRDASFPALKFLDGSGNTDSEIYFGAGGGDDFNLVNYVSGPMIFKTNNVERLRIDASGNLGLGVTPSAGGASGYKLFEIGNAGGGSLYAGPGQTLLSTNIQWDVGTAKYKASSINAMQYSQESGQHIWKTAGTGTAGNNISFTTAMVLTADGNLGVGTTGPDSRLTVNGASNSRINMRGGDVRYGTLFADNGVFAVSSITSIPLVFGTNDTERARITAGGQFYLGTTSGSGLMRVNQTGNDLAMVISQSGTGGSSGGLEIVKTAGGSNALYVENSGTTYGANSVFNNSADGDILYFQTNGTTRGTISISGATVSYNAFAGSHWSQLQDGSKPDILRGTVLEAVNELCEWPGEQNERLPKCKISDTAGSKKVYGVFMAWDDYWTATNDMYVTAVGAFVCRVNSAVTVQEGDLLESNGDGTARVQADDIIRSSTIGKVTSTVKTHEYDDGSYCVPTVLYCG